MDRSVRRARGKLRFFNCKRCDHALRYGASHCGACWEPTPTYNRKWVLVLSVVLVILAVLSAAVLQSI